MIGEHRNLAGATWQTSSYSTGGQNCVEVTDTASVIGIRDTKNRAHGALTVSRATWSTFVHTVWTR